MAKEKKEKIVWTGNPSRQEIMDIVAAIKCTNEPYGKIDEAKDELKEIFADIHERTGIPKRIFNFLAKSSYKEDGYEQIKSNQEMENIFEQVFSFTGNEEE